MPVMIWKTTPPEQIFRRPVLEHLAHHRAAASAPGMLGENSVATSRRGKWVGMIQQVVGGRR